MTLQNISQAANIAKLSIEFDGVEIPEEFIIDFEINFDITLKVLMNFSITDNLDILNQGLNNDTIFKLYVEDNYENAFIHKFNILEVQEIRDTKAKLLNFKCQDFISYGMEHTFVSKSFSGTLSDVWSDYFADYEGDLGDLQIETDFEDATTEYKGIVVPLTMSFYDFITKEFLKEGMLLYQDRGFIGLKNVNSMIPSSLEKIENSFVLNPQNELYPFKIIDYNAKLFRNKEVAKNQLTSLSYDYTKKEMVEVKDENSGFELSTSEVSFNGMTDFQNTIYDYTEDGIKLHSYINYTKNNQIEIVTPPHFMNKVGSVIDVKLPGNIMMKNSSQEGDVVLNGDYLVKEIQDKRIAGSNYIQKLTIVRVDYNEAL
jgi:hypothetical protein